MRLVPTWLAAAALGLSTLSAQAAFVTFEAAGSAAVVTSSRDDFRAAVGGGSSAGAAGSFGGVRREINWDGVPNTLADPTPMPADFFNTTSARGAVFSTPGSGFLVSANAGQAAPVLFGFSADFAAFSSQRLFTAVGSNTTDITFFVPGTSTPASTSAFGAIFVDAEVAALSRMAFYDSGNALLFARDVLVSGNQGFSFLGAVAGAGERIARVRITAGLNTLQANGQLGNPNDDVVVLDDFLYAEPVALTSLPVPEPGSAWLAALGVLACAVARVRSRPAA